MLSDFVKLDITIRLARRISNTDQEAFRDRSNPSLYRHTFHLTIATTMFSTGSESLRSSKDDVTVEQKVLQEVREGMSQGIQSTRPGFNHRTHIEVTRSPNPLWKYGHGATVEDDKAQTTRSSNRHREIDPYAHDRLMVHNYRLLISGIVPRPIGFLSTVSSDGKVKNLAPFSYFQVIDHHPPTFVVGFSTRPGERLKDTALNLKETGECVINTVSEEMIEAVNATSMDAPYGVSEWSISGLHEASTSTVKPSRVLESVFSIEGKLIEMKEFVEHSRPGFSLASLALIKATRFWVREDAVNDEGTEISLAKLRPVAQLGGISYGRIESTFELPRLRWTDEVQHNPALTNIQNQHPGTTQQ